MLSCLFSKGVQLIPERDHPKFHGIISLVRSDFFTNLMMFKYDEVTFIFIFI